MDAWLIWLIVALVLGVAEVFTVTAALAMLAGAAAITAAFAGIGLPLPLQLVAFVLASAAGILLVRPIAQRHMLQPQTERFGIDALVGKCAYVVQEVTDRDGRVRIDGEEWTARAFDETQVIPIGAAVDVLRISGTTAFVYPRE
jgi:membrane protein implicated in regulation of membrane protease activity